MDKNLDRKPELFMKYENRLIGAHAFFKSCSRFWMVFFFKGLKVMKLNRHIQDPDTTNISSNQTQLQIAKLEVNTHKASNHNKTLPASN